MPLCWDLSNASVMIRLDLGGFGEEDRRGEVPVLSQHVDGEHQQCDFSQFMLTWPPSQCSGFQVSP